MKKRIIMALVLVMTAVSIPLLAQGGGEKNDKDKGPGGREQSDRRGPKGRGPGPGFCGPGGGMRRAMVKWDKEAQDVTLQGTLEYLEGFPALKTADKSYRVMGLQHLYGFVKGLEEGAEVTLEGRAAPIPDQEIWLIRAEKLTINGKTYELPPFPFERAK